MTIPDWLSRREGALRPGLNDATLLVVLNGHPQYRIIATPASGKFTCVVTQANSGKRLDAGTQYPTRDAALQGGLEELRGKLGW